MHQVIALTPGSVFAGDFRISKPLAEGLLDSVYVVEQLSSGQSHALKVLHPRIVYDPRSRQRLEREARFAAQLRSDHVARVIAAGIDARTQLGWMATELLRGTDLGRCLEQRKVLTLDEVRLMVSQVCRGLEAAHGLGLVHRDIRPHRIFLTEPLRPGEPFRVKLLGFAYGHLLSDAHRTWAPTHAATVWLPPERAVPSERDVVPGTDFWALGLIAYQLLTGVPYWRNANAQDPTARDLLREILAEKIERPSLRAASQRGSTPLPRRFDAWFAGCVARLPSRRFSYAADVAASFGAVCQHAARGRLGSTMPGLTRATAPTLRRPRRMLSAAMAVGLCTAGLVFARVRYSYRLPAFVADSVEASVASRLSQLPTVGTTTVSRERAPALSASRELAPAPSARDALSPAPKGSAMSVQPDCRVSPP